jgi:hypothetical protein
MTNRAGWLRCFASPPSRPPRGLDRFFHPGDRGADGAALLSTYQFGVHQSSAVVYFKFKF